MQSIPEHYPDSEEIPLKQAYFPDEMTVRVGLWWFLYGMLIAGVLL
jgi:hypothetical protein